MGTESRPNGAYTSTWAPSGQIEYATLADGSGCDTWRRDPARR
jgi:hypothetical protein